MRESKKINVCLTGYGNVGYEFVRLIEESYDYLLQEYGLELSITEIIGREGAISQKEGLDLNQLIRLGKGSTVLQDYARLKQIKVSEPVWYADVLIEATPSNLVSGAPGLYYIRGALERGMHVVLISKGALVTHYQELVSMAAKKKMIIRYSGATAAALPTLDLGEYSLAGSKILRIEGILNGTTNYILTCMHEDHLRFDEALSLAKKSGIAETNSVQDISGLDSACKLLLLCNRFFRTSLKLEDISVKGIEGLEAEQIKAAQEKGNSIKLLAKASMENGSLQAQVSPVELAPQHPLYHVHGTNKGIVFTTNNMGEVAAIGGASNPRGAAAAALKDLINIFQIYQS